MALSWEEIRERKRPTEKTVRIALEGGPVEELEQAEVSLAEAKARAEMAGEDRGAQSAARTEVDEATWAVARHREAVEAVTATFLFRSVGKERYEELKDAHEPTFDQKAKAKKEGRAEPQFNTDTFPIAVVAASIVEPPLSEAEVKELWVSPSWNEAELAALFYGALEVNSTRRVPDLGKGSGLTQL